MDGKKVCLAAFIGCLVIFISFSNSSEWRPIVFSKVTDDSVTGKHDLIYKEINQTKTLRNHTRLSNSRWKIHGKVQRKPRTHRKLNFKSKSLHDLCLSSNQHVIGKNNASSFFTYGDECLYTTIRKVRAETKYKHPENEMCEKRVPKCIIIGVKKAGTRELIDFMSLHPNVVIKRDPYELGYFSKSHYSENPNGTEWYRNKMPCSYSDQITVTKYPWYFSSPQAARRVHKFNKTMKLIVLVRQPIERLISGFTFSYRQRTIDRRGENLSKLPPIERKLLLKNGEIDKNFEEVNLSSYDDSMMSYLNFFTLDQILIIELDEFKNSPYSVLKRVESFLGLQHNISEDTFVYNTDKRFYCIKYQQKAFCYSNERGRVKQPEMTKATKEKLNNYFRPHNEHFFEIIGKRYGW